MKRSLYSPWIKYWELKTFYPQIKWYEANWESKPLDFYVATLPHSFSLYCSSITHLSSHMFPVLLQSSHGISTAKGWTLSLAFGTFLRLLIVCLLMRQRAVRPSCFPSFLSSHCPRAFTVKHPDRSDFQALPNCWNLLVLSHFKCKNKHKSNYNVLSKTFF